MILNLIYAAPDTEIDFAEIDIIGIERLIKSFNPAFPM